MKYIPQSTTAAQIYGNNAVEFASFSDNNEQTMPWHSCKDFEQDMLWSVIHQKSYSIYGFAFDPSKQPNPSLTSANFLLRYKSEKDFHSRAENLQKFLNQVEERFKIEGRTTVKGDKKNGTLVIRGPQKWINHPITLSLYTLLMRVGLNAEGDYLEHLRALAASKKTSLGQNDSSYVNQCLHVIERIDQNGLGEFDGEMSTNYPKATESIHTVHNSGICFYAHKTKKK